MRTSGEEGPAGLARLARECVWTDDAVAFRAGIQRVPDEHWATFEALVHAELEWRARHPPLRQVKLARLREETERRRAAA